MGWEAQEQGLRCPQVERHRPHSAWGWPRTGRQDGAAAQSLTRGSWHV